MDNEQEEAVFQLYARTQPLSRYTIGRCLALIAGWGYDGAEICLENPDIAPETLDADGLRRLGEAIASSGLEHFSVSYHKSYVYDDEALAGARRAIEAARALGTDVCVIGDAVRQTGDAAEWRRMIVRTRELVAVAEHEGVTLAKEFEPNFVVGSTADLLRLFADIPSERMAANLDLGHVFLCDPDPLAAVRQVGDKMVHGHVENMRHGVHDHLVPQEGDMDLAAYLSALKAIGFSGGLALDLYKHDYELVAPSALAYLRQLAAA
jgi:sugar phosphate isomerase/epimerase